MAASPPHALTENDDRTLFDCGRESLNQWFRRYTWSNHLNGMARVNVIENNATGRIIGYIALSSSNVERAFLPKGRQRNSPDPVQVTLLGQLAVDKDYQGQRHAGSLMRFALMTALRASADNGSFGVLTHPLDEGVRRFYKRWGFEDLPYDPRRAMIVRMIDIQQGIGGAT